MPEITEKMVSTYASQLRKSVPKFNVNVESEEPKLIFADIYDILDNLGKRLCEIVAYLAYLRSLSKDSKGKGYAKFDKDVFGEKLMTFTVSHKKIDTKDGGTIVGTLSGSVLYSALYRLTANLSNKYCTASNDVDEKITTVGDFENLKDDFSKFIDACKTYIKSWHNIFLSRVRVRKDLINAIIYWAGEWIKLINNIIKAIKSLARKAVGVPQAPEGSTAQKLWDTIVKCNATIKKINQSDKVLGDMFGNHCSTIEELQRIKEYFNDAKTIDGFPFINKEIYYANELKYFIQMICRENHKDFPNDWENFDIRNVLSKRWKSAPFKMIFDYYETGEGKSLKWEKGIIGLLDKYLTRHLGTVSELEKEIKARDEAKRQLEPLR